MKLTAVDVFSPFPVPDVDNAAVGNAFTSVAGGYHIRDPPAFSYSFERGTESPHIAAD